MRSSLLARGRALTGCACVALTAGGAGCTGTAANSGTSVSGSTLTIWASEPLNPSSEQKDVVDAERLALKQKGSRVGKFRITLTAVRGNELSDNARSAISDPTTIAYLGELEPGGSADTIGITNAQGILQVSPSDTAVALTQSVPEVPGSPDLYYESLSSNGRTFARVVPSTRLEAKALVGEMQLLGVKRLYVANDGSAYGRTLNGLVISDAGSAGITIDSTPSGADAVLYGGTSAPGAAAKFNQAASSGTSVKLFAPSALASGSFVAGLPSSTQRDLYVSSPGFMTSDLPPQAQQFASAFQTAYGHAPSSGAIFGYEAMAAVLSTLQNAGSSANSRGTVVKDFFRIRNRTSVLGTYSIKSGGDISFASGAPFVFSRVRGRKLVPFKAVQQQG